MVARHQDDVINVTKNYIKYILCKMARGWNKTFWFMHTSKHWYIPSLIKKYIYKKKILQVSLFDLNYN